jgi:hypothetical protein
MSMYAPAAVVHLNPSFLPPSPTSQHTTTLMFCHTPSARLPLLHPIASLTEAGGGLVSSRRMTWTGGNDLRLEAAVTRIQSVEYGCVELLRSCTLRRIATPTALAAMPSQAVRSSCDCCLCCTWSGVRLRKIRCARWGKRRAQGQEKRAGGGGVIFVQRGGRRR